MIRQQRIKELTIISVGVLSSVGKKCFISKFWVDYSYFFC